MLLINKNQIIVLQIYQIQQYSRNDRIQELWQKQPLKFYQINLFSISLAALGHGGAILATKAKEEDLNEYQEDDDLSRFSILNFIPFHTWRGIKGWTYQLPEGEIVENVAIGTRWVAVSTDQFYIRVFSHEGIQKHIFCMPSHVVTLCGYENYLCIVYHSGVPLFYSQRMNVKIIDMKNYHTVIETELCLSPTSALKWIGFSDEGQLFSMDYKGIIRVLSSYFGNTWIPVYTPNSKDKGLWIVSIGDGEVTGLELEGDEEYPKATDKNRVKIVKLEVPFLKKDAEGNPIDPSFDNEFLLKTINIKQEELRKNLWVLTKTQRKLQDPEYNLSRNIKEEQEINKELISLDKILMDKVRECLVSDEKEKAISYTERMLVDKSLLITQKLAEGMDKPEIAEKISYLLAEKHRPTNSTEQIITRVVTQIKENPDANIKKKKLTELSSQNRSSVFEELKSSKKAPAAPTAPTAPAVSKPEASSQNVFLSSTESRILEEKEGAAPSDLQFVKNMEVEKPDIPKNPFSKPATSTSAETSIFSALNKGQKRKLEGASDALPSKVMKP